MHPFIENEWYRLLDNPCFCQIDAKFPLLRAAAPSLKQSEGPAITKKNILIKFHEDGNLIP